MPTFDENLNPILREQGPISSEEVYVKAPKEAPSIYSGRPIQPPTLGDGGGGTAYDELNRMSSQSNFGGKGVYVTNAELAANKRYASYNPTLEDQEDFYAQRQGVILKGVNGILKGVNLAATTIAGGFGMVAGLPYSAHTGRLADVWDNPIMRGLDEWNEKVDNEYLPNYYTNKETSASWYDHNNWMTANFLFDKLIKNSGFAVGAMLSGNVANGILGATGSAVGAGAMELASAAESAQAFKIFTPLLRNVARGFSSAKNIEVANILEKELTSIADISAASSEIANIAKTTNAFSEFGDAGRRTAIALYSSAGEASFEALQTAKEYRNGLINEYKKTHTGNEPTGSDLEAIEAEADSVGKTSFFGNLALLGATEYLQLPKLLGSSYSAEKQVANSLLGKVDDVLMHEGKYVTSDALKEVTRFGKLYKGVGQAAKYAFDPKEAGQEIGQYALQIGTQNYFRKAKESDGASVWTDGFLYGMFGQDSKTGKSVGALVSKEGIEGGILGGVTGGLMQARSNYNEAKQTKSNTEHFIDSLNHAPTFRDAFKDRLGNANRGVVLQQQQQRAIIQGDEIEARDLNTDMMHNYIAPRIKYGRFDMIKEDISDLRAGGMTNGGLSILKTQGIANINDTVESFQKRLNNLETYAKNTEELYKSTNLRYGGEVLTDNEGKPVLNTNGDTIRKFSPLVIDKMVYAASKVADYETRIPQVSSKLTKYNIPTHEVLESIIKDSRPNIEATEKALQSINELNVLSEVKDDLKSNLSDVIELSLRRQSFMQEYEDIKSKPLNYEEDKEFAPGDKSDLDVNVIQKEVPEGKKRAVAVEKPVEIGKQYSLKESLRNENGDLILAPKITVLSQTLGGEFEVKMPNGTVKFLTPSQFKDYTMSTEDNSFEGMEDVLHSAFNTVLNRPKFATEKESIEKGGFDDLAGKLFLLKMTNSLELSNAVEKEFNKQAEEIFKERQAKAEKEALYKKKSEEWKNKQASLVLNSASTPGIDTTGIENPSEESRKDESILFKSTTTESEDLSDPTQSSPHIKRSREFLNNLDSFSNSGKIKTILVHAGNAEALGLNGIVQLSYKVNLDTPVSDIPGATDVNDGFLAQVYIVQERGKSYFTDKTGKKLTQVGKSANLDEIVFQTMPTTSINYSNGTPRYRKPQEEEAKFQSKAYSLFRKDLWASDPKSFDIYDFTVSRGIGIENPGVRERNQVGGLLIAEDKIAKQEELIVIPTTGTVTHNGSNLKFPNGVPVLKYGSTVTFLNNRLFTNNEAKALYKAIEKVTSTVTEQIEKNQAIRPESDEFTFIQSMMYWTDGATKADNQIKIDDNTMELVIGDQTYPLTEIANKETEITNQLKQAWLTTNNKTLKSSFTEPFTEFFVDKDGALQNREWKNYQSFLLSSQYPDGKSRNSENTPLTTSIAKPTDEIPYSFKQKYSTLDDLDFPTPTGESKPDVKQQPIAPVPSAPLVIEGFTIDGVNTNTMQTKLGTVEFTARKEGDDIKVTVSGGTAVDAVANNRALDNEVKNVLTLAGQYDADLDTTTLATLYLNNSIAAKLKASTPKVIEEVKTPAPIVEAPTPTEPTEKKVLTAKDIKAARKGRGPGGANHFRVVGFDGKERSTDIDLELFKTWAEANVPNIPYEVLENIITTHDGNKAWGVFENGVAKFVKGGLRGTEYHEIFEGIYNGMLSPTEQEDLLNEFKDKTGTFTDRASGKKINYSEATDEQAKERIADDFADFRLGKLPARSLGEAIRNFFKRIMDFFKSFVNKPNLKDKLFEAISTGQFKDSELSGVSTSMAPQYRAVEGLSEESTHLLVEDMLARSAGILFSTDQKELLYSPRLISSEEMFDQILEMYEDEGIIDIISANAWEDLKVKVKDALRTRGISFEVENENINSEGSNKNDYVKDTFAPEGKSNSSRAVKFQTSTMIEREETNQEKKSSFVTPKPKISALGGYKLLNYNQAFSTMLDKFSNTTGIDKFIDKVVKLANNDANYVSIFQRLGGNMEDKTVPFSKFDFVDWRLFIDNWQTFTKQKPGALIQYKMNGEIFTAAANLFDSVKQEKAKWSENMKIIAQSKTDLIRFNRESKTYKIDEETLKKYSVNNPTNMTKFLSAMGVEFPLSAYKKLKTKSENGKSSQQDLFGKTVSSLHRFLGSNPEVMSLSGEILDINGPLTTLAELYTKVTNPNQDPTYFGVEGQRVGSYSENNFSSVFENDFNESETLAELLDKRPELNDVFSKNSQVLKLGGLFFDAEGNRIKKIKLNYIQGTKEVDENRGITTSSLGLGERFSQEINQNLNGDYYIVIPADGTTEWMMSMGNTITFKEFNTKKALNKTLDIFNGYLVDDINIALEDRKTLKNVKNRSSELRFFKDILSENVLDGVNEMLNNGTSTFSDINSYIDENRNTINADILAFINNTTEKTKTNLLNNNQLFYTGEDTFIYASLDNNFAKENNITKSNVSEELLNDILNFANTNYIINNIEYHKVLFGDPFQFAEKGGNLDETKRIKSFLSPRRTTFDSPEFNTFLNSNLNIVDGIELTEKDPGYHTFKPYTNSVVLKDNNVHGSLSVINKAYGNTDESDAFSWLMDDTYREIKIKNKQWSDNAEKWHQWQMAYTRLNMPGYKYTNDTLKEKDLETVSEKAPKHKIEVLKPIITGNKYGKTSFDLLLHKTAQMPIYYSMVEGTNMERLYTQMFKQQIGYAIVASGAKVGIETTHSLYSGDGSINSEPFNNTLQVPWKAYGIQVETTQEGEKFQTRGSQLTKMSSMNLFDNGNVIGATPERQEYIKKEYENNKRLLDTMHENAYNELLNDMGIEDLGDDFVMKDGTAISETLKREMMRRVVSDNTKDTLELNEFNQFKIPFEASPAYTQIRNILYSMVDKAIVSPKMHGGAHVQVPVTMFESASTGRKLAIKTQDGYRSISRAEYKTLSEEEKGKVVMTDDTLKFYTKENPYCEIMLPHWFKDKFPTSKFPTGESILAYLNSKEGREILTGIGFRIPTQALSSVEVFKVKGFLPQYMGGTVVVPSEITTKAGSDFDIDKLNMYLKSVYVDAEGKVKLIKAYGSEQATKEFYGKVYDDVYKNRIEKITKNIDPGRLIEIFKSIENIETEEEELSDDIIREALNNQDDYEFFNTNRDIMNQIIDIADAKDMDASEYLTKLIDASLSKSLKTDFIKEMYKKSLENEYYSSLERLITLPEVFDQLISPVDDAGLSKVAKELNNLRGYDETKIKNRLLDRNYMTKLRHSFVVAKKWVGISAVNITSLSLKQKSQVYVNPLKIRDISIQDQKFIGNGKVQLKHNTVPDDNTLISLSGTKVAGSNELISDRYSGYATSFVDVAKDPYILDIIQSNLVVSTFMFLENIGVGPQAAFFLNQPIISEYLKRLDGRGSKTLFNKDAIQAIRAEFSISEEHIGLRDGVINQDAFKSNIENYYKENKKGADTDEFISEQSNILDEFLKYAKIASYSFKFTQATNYDTTRVTNGDFFAKKQWETEIAKENNIISSVQNILDSTFIGRQERLLNSSMSAMGAVLKLEDRKLRAITEKILKPYGTKEFISADVFNRIAGKVKSSFLDFIIQNKSNINGEIYDLVVNGETSVVAELEQLKQKYPEVAILRELEAVSGERPNGAKSIKLSVKPSDAYDENRYTGMLLEMRDENEELNKFYHNLIKVSIIQGTASSAISLRSVIPLEDYSNIVSPIMEQLVADPSLEIFAEGMFQKNQFKDNNIVPIVNPSFRKVSEVATSIDQYGNEIFNYRTSVFPNIQLRGIKASDRKIMLLSEKFNTEGVQHDVVKVPRIVVNKKDDERVDMITGKTVTDSMFSAMKKVGDYTLNNFYGYQKVRYASGEPLIIYNDYVGEQHVYKLVNLLGDGNRAAEYYPDNRPSVIDNASAKIDHEMTDAEIVEIYGGELTPQTIAKIETVASEVISENFNDLNEFTEEEKETKLTNFADKYNMSKEQALNYINEALVKDRQSVIDKLKECF